MEPPLVYWILTRLCPKLKADQSDIQNGRNGVILNSDSATQHYKYATVYWC